MDQNQSDIPNAMQSFYEIAYEQALRNLSHQGIIGSFAAREADRLARARIQQIEQSGEDKHLLGSTMAASGQITWRLNRKQRRYLRRRRKQLQRDLDLTANRLAILDERLKELAALDNLNDHIEREVEQLQTERTEAGRQKNSIQRELDQVSRDLTSTSEILPGSFEEGKRR